MRPHAIFAARPHGSGASSGVLPYPGVGMRIWKEKNLRDGIGVKVAR